MKHISQFQIIIDLPFGFPINNIISLSSHNETHLTMKHISPQGIVVNVNIYAQLWVNLHILQHSEVFSPCSVGWETHINSCRGEPL